MFNTYRPTIMMLLALAIGIPTWSASRDEQTMKRAAIKALNTSKHRLNANIGDIRILRSTTAYSIYGTADGGFAMIAYQDMVLDFVPEQPQGLTDTINFFSGNDIDVGTNPAGLNANYTNLTNLMRTIFVKFASLAKLALKNFSGSTAISIPDIITLSKITQQL